MYDRTAAVLLVVALVVLGGCAQVTTTTRVSADGTIERMEMRMEVDELVYDALESDAERQGYASVEELLEADAREDLEEEHVGEVSASTDVLDDGSYLLTVTATDVDPDGLDGVTVAVDDDTLYYEDTDAFDELENGSAGDGFEDSDAFEGVENDTGADDGIENPEGPDDVEGWEGLNGIEDLEGLDELGDLSDLGNPEALDDLGNLGELEGVDGFDTPEIADDLEDGDENDSDDDSADDVGGLNDTLNDFDDILGDSDGANDPANDADGGPDGEFGTGIDGFEDRISFEYVLVMPGAIQDTNAHAISDDGTTATWEFAGDAEVGPIYAESSIEEGATRTAESTNETDADTAAEDDVPGFGVGVALVALLSVLAGLRAVRRRR